MKIGIEGGLTPLNKGFHVAALRINSSSLFRFKIASLAAP